METRFRRFLRLLYSALRLRCALCGRGRLFRNYFRMHAHCPSCQATFEREPGFYLGSIYFNYGLTALVTAVAYPVLLFQGWVEETSLLIGTTLFVVAFPIWFHRYARALWMGFDQFLDPRPAPKP
ncbi:MAG: DUF983 domain-containing protein [Planctomycetes bacterium]|nr:DUF983 domain-containing protein [Planctomycetota bacterium]